MNTTTAANALTYSMDFEMCQTAELAQLIEFEFASPAKLNIPFLMDYAQTLSVLFAIFSMFYAMLSNYLKPKGFYLHFVGISRPSNFLKSTLKLLDNLNAESTLVSLQSSLKGTDSISDLKELIRNTYEIGKAHDIVIVFSHHLISIDNNASLQSVGITNHSLLTLAICTNCTSMVPPSIEPARALSPIPPFHVVQTEEVMDSEYETDSDYPDEVNALFGMYEDYEESPEPVRDINELFGMFKDYESEAEEEEIEIPMSPTPSPTPPPPTWPRPGFDIITQEENVLVHRMPTCGHEMNKDSLYQYALSTFNDTKNIHLTCPHAHDHKANALCDVHWQYNEITDILRCDEHDEHDDHDAHKVENKWHDFAKLELLSARNLVQNKFDVQKCPRCQSVYYKNYDPLKTQLEDIKTTEDIEREFKFECIRCTPGTQQIVERIPVLKTVEDETQSVLGIHIEDDIEEDIDGDAVNLLFTINNDINSDDEEEEEEEDEEDDNSEALRAIWHMFDDDDPDFEEEEKEKLLHGFCWGCGSEWVEGHVCDSNFKTDLVEILQMAETQTIGPVNEVPSIRACPSCSQLIFHIDACKHMNCRGCGIDFCFVCLKPQKDGNWQCGSHGDVCPIAPRQDMDSLPDTIVLTKKSFQLY